MNIVHDGDDRVLLKSARPQAVKHALRRLGTRLRVVDGNHCHLLFPRAGLTGETRVASVLEALRVADLRTDTARNK